MELAEKPLAWLLQDQAVPLELAGIRPADTVNASCLN